MGEGRYHELINIKPVTQTPLVSSLLIFIFTFILKSQYPKMKFSLALLVSASSALAAPTPVSPQSSRP